MDSGTGLDVAASAALRQEIEQTRSAIGAKIAALQVGVRGTLNGASDQVRASLEHAKQSVTPSVQFHRHPGAFCAAAFVCGILLQQRALRRQSTGEAESSGEAEADMAESPPEETRWQRARRRKRRAPRSLLTGSHIPIVAEVVRGLFEGSRAAGPKR